MFPVVDKDVIKAVLESKRGNVESTVTAMLSMLGDNPSPPVHPSLEATQPPASQPPVTEPDDPAISL